MRLLLLDNYDSFTYNLQHYLCQAPGVEVEVWRNDTISMTQALEYQGIVLSPGPGLPSEAGIMPELLQTLKSQPIPVLGVCLGMQGMVESHGGSIKNLNKVWHGLSSIIEVLDSNDPIFKDIPLLKRAEVRFDEEQEKDLGWISKPKNACLLQGGRYHSWGVDLNCLPRESSPLALDGQGLVMAMRSTTTPWYGLQFHPESVMTPHGLQIILNWVECARSQRKMAGQ